MKLQDIMTQNVVTVNREETWPDAADALGDISSNISFR